MEQVLIKQVSCLQNFSELSKILDILIRILQCYKKKTIKVLTMILTKICSQEFSRNSQKVFSFLVLKIVQWYKKKTNQIFNNDSNLKMFSRILKEFSKSLQLSCAKNSTNARKACIIYKEPF